ncbi:MAG: hypothetical protein QOJ50_1980, partial [Cryptosporangiaceae bacterium]|nr:hypothetical protein [Cryptosporangiaceae bacterium]
MITPCLTSRAMTWAHLATGEEAVTNPVCHALCQCGPDRARTGPARPQRAFRKKGGAYGG